MPDIKNILNSNLKSSKVLFDEPMNIHTSFKIGGKADIFIGLKDVNDLIFILDLCKKESIPYYIMGNGTNLLVKDNGFRGIIIQFFKGYNNILLEENNIITVQSGVLLSSIANFALKNSLTGFEFASGIPGTLGGAICMNAGAYDGEMKDIIMSVTALKNNEIIELPKDQLEFEYRNSIIQKENMIALSAKIKLNKGNYNDIQEKMKDLNKRRNEKQPVEIPSAGSTFKRPHGYFAGKLIMDSGLKGFCIGGACVSEKHCGFVVNKGNATANDVIMLIEHIKKTVNDKFNVTLHPEIKIIGE